MTREREREKKEGRKKEGRKEGRGKERGIKGGGGVRVLTCNNNNAIS